MEKWKYLSEYSYLKLWLLNYGHLIRAFSDLKKPSDIYWLAALAAVKDPKSIKRLWTAREGSC